MHLYFTATAFVALFLKCALGAPTTGHQHKDVCNRLQNSSLELNKIARFASLEVHNGKGPVDNYPIQNPFEWIEAKDKCGPGNLKDPEQTCIRKLYATLMSYNSAVEEIGRFRRCPELDLVKPWLQQLHRDMKACDKTRKVILELEATTVSRSQPTTRQPKVTQNWEKDALCRYTADRLFSFSIIVARVFACGDPAHHAQQGSAEKCHSCQG